MNVKSKMWKGFTRSDISKLDSIFDSSVVNEKHGYTIANKYSFCPVCLNYVEHSEDCMFMKHNCSEGQYYNKKLYEKYKTAEGLIWWCTICGRICSGHRHYTLLKHNESPKLIPHKQGMGGSFGEKDCLNGGGGGNDEKFARFRRYREYALKLQGDIDNKTKDDALNELVEEVWNSPFDMLHYIKRKFNRFTGKKSWNLPTNKFRVNNTHKNNNKNKVSNNIPFTGKLPTKLAKGTNDITGDEDTPVIKFHHKQSDNTEQTHGVSEETLKMFIEVQNKNFGDVKKFGYCFMNPACDAKLHPEEIKKHIEHEIYTEYKSKFNNKFNENILEEAQNATCALAENNNNNSKTTRKTKRARRE